MDDQAPDPVSEPQTSDPGRPIFEALLYPHRSLGKRGYLILTAGTAAIIGVYGLVFLILGAWPIFGFLGGEWFLFWYLFTRHHRGNARSERIRLYADHLIFERRDAKGAVVVERLQPYWLNVILERADEPDNALYLRSHGRSIEIGDFLSPDERRDLARELKDVLDRQRRPAYA
jgi:uncharacterized membrane protein